MARRARVRPGPALKTNGRSFASNQFCPGRKHVLEVRRPYSRNAPQDVRGRRRWLWPAN